MLSRPRAALVASLAAAALGVVSLFAACGRSPGVKDEELGNLVIAPKEGTAPINVDKAAKDPAELSRALARPYRELIAKIGPHTYSINTETVVDEAGKSVETLSDHTTIELGATDAYHALYTNSADYGREVIFDGTTMFLRPRYQRWHGRAPESPEEPADVRDSFFEAINATWDLLAPGAELTDGGATQVAGRAARKVIVKLSPSPRTPPSEPLVQRKWREKRTVEAVTGELALDTETGLPLSAKLQGIVSFTRDGRRFSMKLNVDGAATAIGAPVAIAAPAADQVVATPERMREVDDRDFLLQGIAPPTRRNPDGTPVPPSPKFRAGSAGSDATPVPAQAGSNSSKE